MVKGQSLVILRLEGAHCLAQTPLWGRRASCLGSQSDRPPWLRMATPGRCAIVLQTLRVRSTTETGRLYHTRDLYLQGCR